MADNPWTPSARERLPAQAMKPIVESGCWYPDELKGTDAWAAAAFPWSGWIPGT